MVGFLVGFIVTGLCLWLIPDEIPILVRGLIGLVLSLLVAMCFIAVGWMG